MFFLFFFFWLSGRSFHRFHVIQHALGQRPGDSLYLVSVTCILFSLHKPLRRAESNSPLGGATPPQDERNLRPGPGRFPARKLSAHAERRRIWSDAVSDAITFYAILGATLALYPLKCPCWTARSPVGGLRCESDLRDCVSAVVRGAAQPSTCMR